ncbi:MAG: class I SAM-dependent methyltransferase [Patescibacteria group bacterium]
MEEKKTQELLELVKNNYQEIATEFDLTRKKEIWPEIREFAAEVKDGDNVLDVACGNGRLIEALKNKKINYLGVDNSFNLIELAKKNYPDYKFMIGDMLNLEKIENNEFDFIFCLAALQHIPSKDLRVKVLRDMAAKLNSNGKLIISNWNLWSHKKYRPLLIKSYLLKLIGKNKLDFNDLVFPSKFYLASQNKREASDRYYHAHTKAELKKIANLANLKILELKKDRYNLWLVLKK